jgi:mono/diheme cytochrome c family protein/polyisoprenoid-binding protein YceI
MRSALFILLGLTLTHASLAQAAPMALDLDPSRQPEMRFTVDAPLDEIVGTSRALVGSASFDPASGAGKGRVAVDLKSFRTGLALRDEDLRDQFFQAGKYPQAVLTLDKLDPAVAGLLTPGRSVLTDGSGTLSLHGTNRPVHIALKLQAGVQNGQTVLLVQGDFDVRFADYGIPRPKALFLKLGDHAHVELSLSFVGPPPDPAAPAQADAPLPSATLFKPGVFVPVAHAPRGKKHAAPRFEFAETTPEGKGERLFSDPTVGARGNAVSCAACHSIADETAAGDANREGIVHPARSLFDSARRPTFWQGISPNAAAAGALCTRLFLLNPDGLTREHLAQIAAYLDKISPDDVAPALDYQALLLTRATGLKNPTQGDRKRGAQLEQRYCGSCHAATSVRPPLTPGLYEPDYLVKRVRWLDGKDNHQMPPISIDRLPDAELRDIVTYLAGDESKRIFQRKRTAAK